MSAIVAGFQLDVAVSEDHTYDADATDSPVEEGSDISDNIRNRPLQVTLEGIVTDTPIGNMRDVRSGTTLPSEDALAHLLAIREARELITIETSLASYENMALLSLRIPRSAKTGKALRFTAVFKQIRLITNDRTTVPTSSPRGRRKQKIGNLVLVDIAKTISEVTVQAPAVSRLAALAGFR